MADIKYMKAVEWDKLSSAFKKTHKQEDAASWMWLQRKYDGCYGEAVMSASGDRMLSREGKDYTKSCAGILRAIRAAGFTEGSIIGEAYKRKVKFPEISGRFRRQSQGEQDLEFVMHDLKQARPYWQRFESIQRVVAEDPLDGPLCVAGTYEVGEWQGDPMVYALRWKEDGGYDGAILRDPNALYVPGIVKNGEVVKVKPVLSLDLAALDMSYAIGEKTGRKVYTIGVEYRGVRTTVGSGVPHKETDLPAHGQIVQIDCMGLTEDGKLREPRFIAIRTDKDTADE